MLEIGVYIASVGQEPTKMSQVQNCLLLSSGSRW